MIHPRVAIQEIDGREAGGTPPDSAARVSCERASRIAVGGASVLAPWAAVRQRPSSLEHLAVGLRAARIGRADPVHQSPESQGIW